MRTVDWSNQPRLPRSGSLAIGGGGAELHFDNFVKNRPILDRLDQLIPKGGKPMLQGLGRATITAILQIAFPDKYGVLNGTVETAMKNINIWPEFDSGATFAERYLTVIRYYSNCPVSYR